MNIGINEYTGYFDTSDNRPEIKMLTKSRYTENTAFVIGDKDYSLDFDEYGENLEVRRLTPLYMYFGMTMEEINELKSKEEAISEAELAEKIIPMLVKKSVSNWMLMNGKNNTHNNVVYVINNTYKRLCLLERNENDGFPDTDKLIKEVCEMYKEIGDIGVDDYVDSLIKQDKVNETISTISSLYWHLILEKAS